VPLSASRWLNESYGLKMSETTRTVPSGHRRRPDRKGRLGMARALFEGTESKAIRMASGDQLTKLK
jgi:hypothetical protein